MSGSPNLRPAVPGDLTAVLDLIAASGLPADGVDTALLPGMCVAEAGSDLVGCAAVEVHGEFGLLRSVAVAASRRGSGLGVLLVEDRARWSAARGLSRLYLLTTTAPGFFARLGFREIARDQVPEAVRASREFDQTCPDSAVVMERLPRVSAG